ASWFDTSPKRQRGFPRWRFGLVSHEPAASRVLPPRGGALRMSLPQSSPRVHAVASRPTDPLEAISMFQQGRDPVPLVMRRLVHRLERASIPYAVMGGMAVYAHGHQRMTNDVDVLLTRAGLDEFR